MTRRACSGFKELMVWQAAQMRAAIELDKLDLSTKAHRDVGVVAAEKHHLEHFWNTDSENWRRLFCGQLCEHRAACDLGRAMVENAA